MRLPALALFCAVVLPACLVGEVTGIPCGADDDCATAHFCDLTVGTCRAEADGVSAPRLQISGIVIDDAAPVVSPFIPKTGTSSLQLVLENRGGLPATEVRVELSELACMAFVVDESTLPAGVVSGGSARVALTATPDGTCGTPMIVDWFLFFSERGSRGTFNLNLD